MTRPIGVARIPVAPIKSQVAAKLYPQPVTPPRPVRPRPARSKQAAKNLPTPITIGQAFRVCIVLLVGFTFAPLPQIDGAQPVAVTAPPGAG